MNLNLQELVKNIEDSRQEMIQVAVDSSFVDQRVVRLSGRLDRLLNQYHRLSLIEKQ